jgi:hypothetical protein
MVPLVGLVLTNGCLAAVERNLDYLAEAGALEHSLLPPSRAIAAWALLYVSSLN